jgi:hypothetical protein
MSIDRSRTPGVGEHRQTYSKDATILQKNMPNSFNQVFCTKSIQPRVLFLEVLLSELRVRANNGKKTIYQNDGLQFQIYDM